MIEIFHATDFKLPLPPHHRFPMEKYEVLRHLVAQYVGENMIHQAPRINDNMLFHAHDQNYVQGICDGTLSSQALRRIGFPWSPAMIERSRRSAGATWGACLSALREGRGINLAGGTHHAHSAQGGGYCVFNDSCVALLNLQNQGYIKRSLVIDLDVHQGDGTAEILSRHATHFSFSIHGKNNYPFHKMKSDYDIALANHCGDQEYLKHLSKALPYVFEQATPDLVIYLAGADPYEHDRLGKLGLSMVGLVQRDKMVFEACDRYGVPVAVTMGGGYAECVQEIANIHLNTVLLALDQSPIELSL